jgi:hypothetical protein
MPVSTLTLRLVKGSKLTPGEVDGNFTKLRDHSNGLETQINASLDGSGNLKGNAISSASQITDGIITGVKLADQAVTNAKLNNAVAGNGLLKAVNADPLSVNLDNVTLEFDGSTPKKIQVKAGSITSAMCAAGVAAGSHVVVADEQGAGTDGGTFTSGAWRTRTLQTIKRNVNSSLLALASNQIRLKAGTYRCHIVTVGHACALHKARLYNTSSSVTLAVGTNAKSDASDATPTNSVIIGYFTVADDNQLLEVQHQCSATKATNGFGIACNMGEVEVYTVAEFFKEV